MSKVIIIAEIGINHNGDMDIAKKLIAQSKATGAHIAKFQLYDVDRLFPDKKVISIGQNWYEKVKKTQLSFDQVKILQKYCKKAGIEFMASAFDIERVGWLEKLNVKRHKIGTRVNQNMKLIKAMVSTGKEIIISSKKPLTNLPIYPNYTRLYCIPLYPAPSDTLKLSRISFPEDFHGFSDHALGIYASQIAIARGAMMIEKHFTFDITNNDGPDHLCSITLPELEYLCSFAKVSKEMLK